MQSNQETIPLHEKEQREKTRKTLLVLGILLIAINLRTPITTLGPLVGTIRNDLHFSGTLAGFLTTLPLLAFAAISPFVSKWSRKYGVELVLFLALISITLGNLIRPLGNISILLFGTLLIGIGIAAGNVLIPSVIKKEFPFKLGLMTGVYSIFMNLIAATASGLATPIARNKHFGWQGTLWLFGTISIIALIVWSLQLRHNRMEKKNTKNLHTAHKSIWKSPLAWQVTVFMGAQSAIFYVSVAWLPNILAEQGIDLVTGGIVLSILQFSVMPITFVMPIIAGKMKNQIFLVILTTVLWLIGLGGIMMETGNLVIVIIAAILYGVAGGSAFSLSMMFFSLRTRTAQQSADLSGMAQSIGYLIAAICPTLFGALHDWSGSYAVTMWLLVAVVILLFFFGLGAARDKKI